MKAKWKRVASGRPVKKSEPAMPAEAITASPVARPSSPSMKLKAFTAPTIQKTVTAVSSAGGIDGNIPAKPTPQK